MINRPNRHRILCLALFLGFCVKPAASQTADPATDPPNSSSGGGKSATGMYSLDKIESINSINGNVSLSIPAAHLPPGPAGFSVAVNLIYNSSIFDLATQVPTSNTAVLQMSYVPSVHGGGWGYSYKYTLWSQTRVSIFNSATCGAATATEAANWYKTILATPDGANHVLRLVGALNASGGTYTGSLSTDTATQSYDLYDFGGYTNLNCGLSLARFSGTLIFATADSTFVRVEANTVTNTWVAYFPDGTQVSGPIAFTGQPHATDSDATQIVDRHGNALTITGSCAVGSACTETLMDSQGRNVTMTYTSNASGTWTDTIAWPGPNGGVTTSVNWLTATPYALPYFCQVTPAGTPNSTVCNLTQTASVVSSIQLPATSDGNSTNFQMYYGPLGTGSYSWGELHTLTQCIGTDPLHCQAQWAVDYGYKFDTSTALPSSADSTRPPGTIINPITTKTVRHTDTLLGQTQPLSDTTQYTILVIGAYPYPTVSGSSGSASQVTYPDGSYTVTYTTNLCPSTVKSRDLCVAVPFETLNRDGSLTELLWASNTAAPGVPTGALFNPYVTARVDTPPNGANGVVKITSTQKDTNGNATSAVEYDWTPYSVVTHSSGIIASVCSSGCTPARTTTTVYNGAGQTYWTHGAPAVLRSPQSITVGNAKTTFTYDSALTTANVVQIDQSDSTTGGMISTARTYLANGNVQSQTDANNFGVQGGSYTLICYDANNLYPVSRIVGATNSSCPLASAVPEGQTTTFVFNSSGMLTSMKDADNNVTTYYGYDNVGRTIRSEQIGGGLDRVTTTTYDDVNLVTTTTQDDTATKLVVTTYYDALGRVRATTDGVGVQTQKAYRFGTGGLSYELASNPYASTSDPTMGWSVTTRDAMHGTVTSTSYSGSLPPSPFWASTNPPVTGTSSVVANLVNVTGCPGTGTKTTDAAGNIHTNCADGLGRLAAAIEPNGTMTCYSYDLLNNMIGVSVTGPSTSPCPTSQLRTFSYSSLSRLTSSFNPESGTVGYLYDKNGNVTQRTDARSNTTTFGPYDSLNRVKGITYSVASGTAPTPNVCYTYDVAYGTGTPYKGALSSVRAFNGTTTCATTTSFTALTGYAYDAFGRVVTSSQIVNGGTPYNFAYSYSLTDQLTQITYPSGRKIGYVLDAADRVQTVQNVDAGTNYATLTYTAPGGEQSMTMLNGITEQPSWNDRNQPTGLSVTSSAGSLLTLGLYPCTSNQPTCANGNNGNLQSQTIAMPGLSVTQTYGYDNLNRLTSAAETGGGSGWNQAYQYYGNGNRYVSAHVNLPPLTPETPTAASAYSASLVVNRINTWTYDNSGNVQNIPLVNNAYRGFTYDAESRQATASISDGTNTASSIYTYDGNGQRISKTANGQTTTYVYDAFGNLAAEYGPQEASPCGTSTCYITVDHLGSTRLMTDSNGAVQRRYDYQPFGAEITANYAGRTTGLNYLIAADDVNPKFTGKQRDPETGLDWFEIRHMSGGQGRFQSVDPGSAGADPSDPQTWNAYSYVGNNPLSYTDPSGECWWCVLVGVILDIAGAVTLQPEITEAGIIVSTEGVGLLAAGTALEVGSIGPDIVGQLSLGMNPMLPVGAAAGGGGLVIGGGTISLGAIGDWVLGAIGCASGGCEVAAGAVVIGGVVYVGTHWGAPPKPQPTIWRGGATVYPSYETTMPQLGLTFPGLRLYKENTKGARPSTEEKHEDGQARKKIDAGGEKGDEARQKNGMYPRRPPGGKQPEGGWPPKAKKP